MAAWGDNTYGECEVPEGSTRFVAVAAGGAAFSLALAASGSIVAWGYNAFGQCDVPEPNRDFVAIDAGWGHGLGLKSDGSIVGWGSNHYGQCDAPVPNTGFSSVSGGTFCSLALRAEGGPARIDAGSEPGLALIKMIYPNPVLSRTTVLFEAPRARDGSLRVFDVEGRLVRTLWQGSLPAGSHRAAWDGLDDQARTVPAGVYLMRLETAAGGARVAKVILTR
jgi:hypothetical protein